MIYNDGYETDENLKFVRCPKCGNEEYSQNAQYCRICGFSVYNECEGCCDYDEYGNQGIKFIEMQGTPDIANSVVSQQCSSKKIY